MSNQQTKEFTGVWIPREIIEDVRLKPIDKILYSEIACFSECYKKQEALLVVCGVGVKAFQASCRRLEEYGYIEQKRKFGKIYRRSTIGFVQQSQKGVDEQSQKGVDEQSQKGVDEERQNGAVLLDNNKDNNKDNKRIEQSSTSYREIEYHEPPKETFKTKKKIFEQKGMKYVPPKKTSRQEKTTQVLSDMTYFREQMMEMHGQVIMSIQDKSRDTKIRSLAIRAIDAGVELRKLIDWWIAGEGEWCDYAPENCFMTKTLEKFQNKDNKKNNKNNMEGGVIYE